MDPLIQSDYIDGKIAHVADSGGVVHVDENGTTHRCTVSEEDAARLRPFVGGPTLRTFGTATWMRHSDGQWELQAFSIENFTPLDDRPLDQVLK